jgi:site-specific DNA-methyltransferase (adenine-specific)
MEFMATIPDKFYDLAVVDPPYGLGKRLSDGGGKLENTPMKKLYEQKEWDTLPNEKYWSELFRVSKHQVVFGANYFLGYLPASRGFVVWDKLQAMPTLSACELVWTSFDRPAKMYQQSSTDLERFHPTQKPVELYEYMLRYCRVKPNQKILDTHLGSASISIAIDKANKLDKMGLTFDGVELDAEYYEKGVQRMRNHLLNQYLF